MTKSAIDFRCWLTPGAAARALGVSTKRLSAWADKGLLTVVRGGGFGGHRRYLEGEINMILAEAIRLGARPTAEIAEDVALTNRFGVWRRDRLGQHIRDALGAGKGEPHELEDMYSVTH